MLITVEVEENLIVGRTQSESVDHWKICDTLFPSTITKCQLSVAENIKYRLVNLTCPYTYIQNYTIVHYLFIATECYYYNTIGGACCVLIQN